jgi:hypothetical protein
MAAFKVFIRQSGEEGKEVEVTPETTVGEIKAQKSLKGYAFRFKGSWNDSSKMVDLGIKAGETINVFKTSLTPEKKAALRLKAGEGKRSTAHGHLNLHAQTQGVVVDAVMSEGQKVADKVDKVKDDTAAIRNFFEGGEVHRKEGQSDKARVKELRLLKRTVDNEIGDLKEREQKRIRQEKNDSIAAVQQAAEIAQGSVDIVVGDIMDKETLKAQYKAQMTVITQHEKAARTAERQALQKAKGSAKGKAKGKAKVDKKKDDQDEVEKPNAEEHDADAKVDTAKDDDADNQSQISTEAGSGKTLSDVDAVLSFLP